MGYETADKIRLAQEKIKCRSLVNMAKGSGCSADGEIWVIYCPSAK